MSMPLRELALILLMVPTAVGFQAGFGRADILCDPLHEGEHRTALLEVGRPPFGPSACTEESMLTTWEVQLKLIEEVRGQHAVNCEMDIAYEPPTL